MNESNAVKIREYVQGGDTVVITSQSEILDEYNSVFAKTLPA